MMLSLGSANHDETRWDEPEKFDIFRERKPHIGFAHGAHVCLGMHLARLESMKIFNALFDELPGCAGPRCAAAVRHRHDVPFTTAPRRGRGTEGRAHDAGYPVGDRCHRNDVAAPVIGRPDLDLVGVRVYDPDKAASMPARCAASTNRGAHHRRSRRGHQRRCRRRALHGQGGDRHRRLLRRRLRSAGVRQERGGDG